MGFGGGGSTAAAIASGVLVGGRVNREKTCPFLVRVFLQQGETHRAPDAYKPLVTQSTEGAATGDAAASASNADVQALTKDELQIYTWHDATFRELTNLIKRVSPAAQRPAARLSFAVVFPSRVGDTIVREVGTVASTRPGEFDRRSLADVQFAIGDYLDVTISGVAVA